MALANSSHTICFTQSTKLRVTLFFMQRFAATSLITSLPLSVLQLTL